MLNQFRNPAKFILDYCHNLGLIVLSFLNIFKKFFRGPNAKKLDKNDILELNRLCAENKWDTVFKKTIK